MTPAVVLALAMAAQAQVRSPGGVEIADVVSTVLAGSPDIEQARLAVEAEAGAHLLAASHFDLEVRTSLRRSQESVPLASVPSVLATRSVESRSSAAKSFRSGLAVSTELSLANLRGSAIGAPTRQVVSSTSVRVPLSKGRGGGAAAGAEQGARQAVTASRLERDHIAAGVVHDAVLAYWRYLAADERLRTYAESADRARRLVEETEVLVRADERPASDLDLMASNRAQKLTAVTAARQTLLDAQYALGVAMGLMAGAIPRLGPPSTGFPETAVVPGSAGGAAARAAVRMALAVRRDLAALRSRRDGARRSWEGALRDVRPRWDVVARLGYTSVAREAEPGGGTSFAPRAAGLNGLLQLQYEPLAANRESRGRALGRAASHRAVAVAADDLARRIEANVLVALEAVGNAAQEVRMADEAVRLSERSVRTEQAKFRLGLAALFDAILAEDSLTNARLRRTNARFRFAAALVRLRFETGTLIEVDGGKVSADPDRVTSFVLRERKP